MANAREVAKVCQQDQRARLKQINERAQEDLYNSCDFNPHEELNPRDDNRVALKIVHLLAKEFGQIAGHDNRQVILVKVLQHDTIVAILPKYYPKLHDAKAQLAFNQNFKNELCQVKRCTLNNLLAHKSVLLSVAISTHESNVGGISKILSTKRSNLHCAMEQRRPIQILEVFPVRNTVYF